MKAILKTILILAAGASTACDALWDLNMEPGKPVYADQGMKGTVEETSRLHTACCFMPK